MIYSRACRRLRILFAVALALLLLFPSPAMAEEGEGMSYLTLRCQYVHSGGRIYSLTGDVYALYLVADAKVERLGDTTTIVYDAVPEFAELGDAWAGLEAAELHARAMALAEDVAGRKADYSLTIGSNGEGSLRGFPNGLYLCVREYTAPRNSEYDMDPFLFSSVMIEDNAAFYELIVTPKYSYDGDDGGGGGGGGGGGRDPYYPYYPYPDRPYYGGARTTRYYYGDDYGPGADDPGSSTVTIENPTTPLVSLPNAPTPLAGKPLPQTGQLKWPIPFLIVFGVMFFITGFDLRYGNRRHDEEK